jgi:hypothetical protein
MKPEHTIDKPARAGRATQIAAMVITGLVAFIWVYFGRLYLIHDPEEWRIANQQLGYPALYHPSDWRDPHSWWRGPSDSQCASIDWVGLCWSRDRSSTRVLFTNE